MPIVSRFYGIVIKMFFRQSEHNPPHLHAQYGEHVAIFDLRTCEMLEGDFPRRAQSLTTEWMKLYQKELLRMWDTNRIEQLPPLN